VGRLAAQLCLFLQAAHDNGLLHRDLTPANIMVVHADSPDETIKVMDFGLARRIGFYIPSGQLNRQSSVIDGGTPDYICPEQLEARQVDHRGDLFSVGVLLYGMLTGHVPFEDLDKPIEIMLANIHQPPPRFSHWHIHDVPSAIETLVLSCMAKSPTDRPESARALIETYELCLGQSLLEVDAFDTSAHHFVSTLQERHRIDPGNVIDQFEALMLEHTAAIKLRGFVESVDGEVGECDAGVIKFRLPRVIEDAPPKKSGLWSWLKKPELQIDWVPLELHMAKADAGTRSMVDITVVRPPVRSETIEQAHANRQFCDQVCRELRAYLMAGR
jgi:serine/threonine-protein kinase